MSLLSTLTTTAAQPEIHLDLSVYKAGVLEQILTPIEQYLATPPAPDKRRWPGLRKREPAPSRIAPLLLSGPVGTGKTTLMMLLDRALPQASCAPLFQQEMAGHPSTADNGSNAALIEIRPLALMGQSRNIATGVIRLRELQTFFRLATYDRRTASTDPAAAQRFVTLFRGNIIYIDEFVPDSVTAFPMQVINLLADNGVLVVLTSNRRETPFVEGVTIVMVEGDDMRTGNLRAIVLPAAPDPRFDGFASVTPTAFDSIATGLQARVARYEGRTWLYLRYPDFAGVPADWLAFQHLLQHGDGVLIDAVPLFDPMRAGGADGARRFVFLIDAIYDERRPVLVRMTNPTALERRFDIYTLADHYLPEVLVDLERALSRLRQLSTLFV